MLDSIQKSVKDSEGGMKLVMYYKPLKILDVNHDGNTEQRRPGTVSLDQALSLERQHVHALDFHALRPDLIPLTSVYHGDV